MENYFEMNLTEGEINRFSNLSLAHKIGRAHV